MEVRLPLTDNDLSKVDLPIAYVAKDRETAPDVTLSAVIGGKYQTWPGKIMRTDSAYDTQTRALFAIAEVFDPYGKGASESGVPLAPGLFVDAEVLGRKHEGIVVISRDGLRPENKVFIAKDDGTAEARTAVVLDTTMQSAFITSGVSTGEMVILSPVEESRLIGPLKVVDINDPSIVFVDPPKPDWLIAKEKAADEEKKNGGKKKRRKNKDNEDDSSSQNSDSTDAAAVSKND
jgi:multidrug efflux pump subunit AcrA (membrane-fusion protein)